MKIINRRSPYAVCRLRCSFFCLSLELIEGDGTKHFTLILFYLAYIQFPLRFWSSNLSNTILLPSRNVTKINIEITNSYEQIYLLLFDKSLLQYTNTATTTLDRGAKYILGHRLFYSVCLRRTWKGAKVHILSMLNVYYS